MQSAMNLHTLFCLIAALAILNQRPAAPAEPAAKPGPEPKLTVVNVSSHCDWCWGHTRLWHEQRYAEIVRQVLLLMREHPHYVWLLENENEELAPFLDAAERQWPELIPEFWQRVREGRIEIIGAVSNPRLTEVYPETMVRNLVLGKQYSQRHAPGIPLEVYNSIDLMCGPTQMPQILAKAGYRYFMFSRPVGPQAVFWRRGLDGTRMLSSKCFYGYDKMGTYGQPLEGFLPVSIWREAIGADDALPDPKLPQEAAGWDPQKKIFATNRRYFEEVEKCGEPITELQGPLDSLECYVEAGIHGDRSLYMQNNQDEDLLLSLEKAQVMALRAGEPLQSGTVDRLWRDVLSCTGHAIQWAWTMDYEERLAFARHRRVRIEQALHETLSTLTGKIKFRADLGSPLVVFNFHAWPVSGPAEFAVEGDTAGLTLRDASSEDIPLQLASQTRSGQQLVAFIAEAVPACGYRTFYVNRSKDPVAATPGFIPGSSPVENAGYRAQLRTDGTLEIFDKVRQAPLGSAELGGLGDIVYYDAPPPVQWEMNGPLGPAHRWTIQESSLEHVQGPVFSALRAKGTFGPHSATREFRLWRDGRRLDYHLELDAAEGNGVFAIRYPLDIDGRVFAGIPFGAEPRESFDQEPFRGEYFVKGYPTGYYATRWTDVSSNQFGYTFICPPGAHTGYAFNSDQDRRIPSASRAAAADWRVGTDGSFDQGRRPPHLRLRPRPARRHLARSPFVSRCPRVPCPPYGFLSRSRPPPRQPRHSTVRWRPPSGRRNLLRGGEPLQCRPLGPSHRRAATERQIARSRNTSLRGQRPADRCRHQPEPVRRFRCGNQFSRRADARTRPGRAEQRRHPPDPPTLEDRHPPPPPEKLTPDPQRGRS